MANNNWPDCSDAGRQVEITVDGIITQGCLHIIRYGHDTFGTYPIFNVIDSDNVNHCFAMNDDWKFL